MRPRRGNFASDYIVETVGFFSAMARKSQDQLGAIDIEELNWARDVPEEYLHSIATPDSKLDNAKAAFQAIPVSISPFAP